MERRGSRLNGKARGGGGGAAGPGPYPGAMRAPFAIFDDFLLDHEAEALRAPIDLHFSEPHQHRFDSHFVWNYWYVPGLYTYLRAAP